jgi:hypothetical protein
VLSLPEGLLGQPLGDSPSTGLTLPDARAVPSARGTWIGLRAGQQNGVSVRRATEGHGEMK